MSNINGHSYDDITTIEYAPNPKRPGFKAHARYEVYSTATTIEEYFEIYSEKLEKKYAAPDLRYDEEHGHLKLLDAEGNVINEKIEE